MLWPIAARAPLLSDWLTLVAQVTMPSDSTNPWIWMTGTLVIIGVPALAFLAKELLKRTDAESTEWKTQAKSLTAELSKTTDSLRSTTDVVERGRQATVGLVEDVAALTASVARIEAFLASGGAVPDPPRRLP